MKLLQLLFAVFFFASSTSLANETTPQIDVKEMQCLAKNIYFEARGESVDGQMAVGAVTINRTEAERFPESVCGVVYQKNKRGCQFSWTCDGKSDRIRDYQAYSKAIQISFQILTRNYVDNTSGSLYYHANRIRPYWAKHLVKTTKIGQHVFYKI